MTVQLNDIVDGYYGVEFNHIAGAVAVQTTPVSDTEYPYFVSADSRVKADGTLQTDGTMLVGPTSVQWGAFIPWVAKLTISELFQRIRFTVNLKTATNGNSYGACIFAFTPGYSNGSSWIDAPPYNNYPYNACGVNFVPYSTQKFDAFHMEDDASGDEDDVWKRVYNYGTEVYGVDRSAMFSGGNTYWWTWTLTIDIAGSDWSRVVRIQQHLNDQLFSDTGYQKNNVWLFDKGVCLGMGAYMGHTMQVKMVEISC